MAFIVKTLGAGTVTQTGSPVDLYTVPDPKSAIVSSVRFANNDTSNQMTLNVYVKPSGTTARRIAKKDHVVAAKGTLVIEDAVTLGKGDKIQVNQSGPGTLDYMVNGLERD